MPFTPEQFFEVFAAYNLAIWPVQVGAYLAGLVAVALAFRPARASTGAILSILSLMWLVNGAAYRRCCRTHPEPIHIVNP